MVPAEDLFQEAPNRTFDGVLTCRFPGIMGILPLGLTGRRTAPQHKLRLCAFKFLW